MTLQSKMIFKPICDFQIPFFKCTKSGKLGPVGECLWACLRYVFNMDIEHLECKILSKTDYLRSKTEFKNLK